MKALCFSILLFAHCNFLFATTSASSLTLVDASTNQDIAPLIDGYTIDSTQTRYSVRANAPSAAQSVVFYLDNTKVRTENTFPFSVAGDDGGNYHPWNLPNPGTHTLTATAFSKPDGQGTMLATWGG